MEIAAFIIAYVTLLYSVDSYIKKHLEKDDREFRIGIITVLRRNYFYKKYRFFLKKGLDFLQYVYGDIGSEKAFGTSIVIAMLYSTMAFLIFWLFGGSGEVASIILLPDMQNITEKIFYTFSIMLGFIVIFISTAIFIDGDLLFKIKLHRYGVDKKLKTNYLNDKSFKEKLDKNTALKVGAYIYNNITSIFSIFILLISLLSPFVLFSIPNTSIYTVIVIILAISTASSIASSRTGGLIATLPYIGFIVGSLCSLFVSELSWLQGGLIGAGAAFTSFFTTGTSSKPKDVSHVPIILFIIFIYYLVFLFLLSDYKVMSTEINFIKHLFHKYIDLITDYKLSIEKATPIIFFIVIIPLANGLWDWISLDISRLLAKKALNEVDLNKNYLKRTYKLIIIIVMDIIAATFMFALLVLNITILISSVNAVTANLNYGEIISFSKLANTLEESPFSSNSIWITFLIITTLIPTFLHIIIAFLSLSLFNFKTSFDCNKLIKGLKKHPIPTSIIRKSSFYLSITIPSNFLLATIILTASIVVAKSTLYATSDSLIDMSKYLYNNSFRFFSDNIRDSNLITMMKSFTEYYEAIDDAKEKIRNKEYDEAIILLNNAIKNEVVKEHGAERLYIEPYYLLGLIYFEIGNKENSYINLELSIKYSLSNIDQFKYNEFYFLLKATDLLIDSSNTLDKKQNSEELFNEVQKKSDKYINSWSIKKNNSYQEATINYLIIRINIKINNEYNDKDRLIKLFDDLADSWSKEKNNIQLIKLSVDLYEMMYFNKIPIKEIEEIKFKVLSEMLTTGIKCSWIYHSLAWQPVYYFPARQWTNWLKAKSYAEMGVQATPDDPYLLNTLATILCFIKKYDEAHEVNEDALFYSDLNDERFMRYYNLIAKWDNSFDPDSISNWNNL